MLPGGIRNSGIRDIHNLNIRFSLIADLPMLQVVRFVPEADVADIGIYNLWGEGQIHEGYNHEQK